MYITPPLPPTKTAPPTKNRPANFLRTTDFMTPFRFCNLCGGLPRKSLKRRKTPLPRQILTEIFDCDCSWAMLYYRQSSKEHARAFVQPAQKKPKYQNTRKLFDQNDAI